MLPIFSFVSILAAATPAASVSVQGKTVTVRCYTVHTMVQGSGTVKTFDRASDMGRVGVCK